MITAYKSLLERYVATNPGLVTRLSDEVLKVDKDYPQLTCEVYGATGAARIAPQPLASYLGLHPERDIEKIYSRLAECRAKACLEALVLAGVGLRWLRLGF